MHAKSAAENISPVHVSGGDWKYISIVTAPPIDSPNKKAGRSRYRSPRRVLKKNESDAAAALSMSPMYPGIPSERPCPKRSAVKTAYPHVAKVMHVC
ncbi:hypothetical protein AG4045_023679 [Apium graveolens]|uniref:Uncharacterized protein n=1 Tax=Apium graveolens TaxID=4045 RepID=A0A6L5BBE8_APIGR|nr:hypothetical protein AG4045_023679 [Apium graveolens]